MNTPRGSTSATLEDPKDAKPDQEQPQGGENQPEQQPQGEDSQQTEGDAPDGQDTPPQKTEPQPTDKAKPADATAEDPVQAAIARLASDGPKTDAAKPQAKAQPAKAGEAKPTNGATTEPTAEDGEGDDAATLADPNDALAGWTFQERKHTKGTVKQRFRELDTKVKTLEPDAVVGKGWSELIQSHNLTPDIQTLDDDQVAWSIRAQGAAIRAVQAVQQGRNPSQQDLDTLDRLRTGIAEVDKAIGRRAEPTDPHAVAEAFTGPIPDDIKEAGEIAGLSDKEMRAVAALRTHKPVTKPPPAPAPQNAPPARRESEPSPAHDQRAQVAEHFWAKKTNQAITEKLKLKPEQVQGFFDQSITPRLAQILQRDYPGANPMRAFQQLGPGERHQLVMEALIAHQQAARPTSPPPTSPGRTPLRAGGDTPGSPGAPADPVEAAIAKLRSD